MTEAERLVADYAGTGLTVGRHPMALRREELATRGVLRACDLRAARQGRRVRVAGMVITRQRPGTAKGFVFLTLEDETGIANIIVRPDLFARDRLVIVEEPFLIVDGVLQSQDGVTSVRAEQVQGMRGVDVDFDAHDFYSRFAALAILIRTTHEPPTLRLPETAGFSSRLLPTPH